LRFSKKSGISKLAPTKAYRRWRKRWKKTWLKRVGMLIQVGLLCDVGRKMGETTAKVDEKGRVMIPKSIREAAKLKEGSYVSIKAKGKTIIMEATEPVADKYYGAFKIANWPEDMDEFIEEMMQKWWIKSAT